MQKTLWKKPIDADQQKEFKKEMAKVKRMILNGVWDHIVSHVSSKNTAKEMWDALSRLYQNPSKQWKMFLKEKLRNISMHKVEGIDPFLTRI